MSAAGNVRQAIQLDAAHGQPVLLDSCGDVLAAATAGGHVCMYTLVRRELKQNCGPGGASPSLAPAAATGCSTGSMLLVLAMFCIWTSTTWHRHVQVLVLAAMHAMQ